MVNVTHQPCPFCESSDAFSYDKEKNVYGCFKCDRKGRYSSLDSVVVEASYVDNNRQSYTPKAIVTSVGKHTAMRSISQKTMEDYGVLTYGDQQEYVYPSGGKKVRTLSKLEYLPFLSPLKHPYTFFSLS